MHRTHTNSERNAPSILVSLKNPYLKEKIHLKWTEERDNLVVEGQLKWADSSGCGHFHPSRAIQSIFQGSVRSCKPYVAR